jgi:type IV pilus biogenesis protein CpaD/CtpE
MRAMLSVALLSLLTACAQDPFERPHTWSLPPAGLGANDSNLRTMLANPNDLVAGTGDDTSTGPLSVRPIDALVTGRRRPLPSVNASTIGASEQQGAQGGAGAGTQAGTGAGGTQ